MPHSAELIQVFFAGQLSDEEILAMFERAAEKVAQVLENYEHIPQQAEAYAEYMRVTARVFLLDVDAGCRFQIGASAIWRGWRMSSSAFRNHEIPAA